jgi:hypothetical protein
VSSSRHLLISFLTCMFLPSVCRVCYQDEPGKTEILQLVFLNIHKAMKRTKFLELHSKMMKWVKKPR